MYTPQDFLRRWQIRRDDLAHISATVDGAKLITEILADAKRIFARERETALTLDLAAQRSGYSKEHLARLVRNGVIPNAGRRGAPRIAVQDLPNRPLKRRPLDSPRSRQYNPIADARAIRDRFRSTNEDS